ncbi:FAD binding domain-containing protein [Nemania sp. FL0916]|nr:FAD binding domain-containing protein [Nemania sp. FL0916]
MSASTEHDLDVLIVGGGPAGTMLALELAAQGVSFRVVDKAPQRSDKSRAIIIQPRSFEMMNRHGIAHKLYKKGNPSGGPLCWLNNKPIVDVNIKTVANYKDSEFALPCLLSQAETEGYLDECLRERYGREIEHGIEAESILQDREGVNVILRNVNEGTKEEIRAKYVIGADGAHSIVRKSSGNIKFDGGTYAQEFIMCDGMIEGFTLSPDRYHLVLGNGLLIVFPMARGWFRVMASRGAFSSAAEPTLEEMQTVLGNKLPGGGKITNTTWVTNFRLHHRIVDSYRDARLFVIGDAAHLHSPVGGQGLNTSLQDAVNLGWKLARAARGDGDRDGDGDGLLDSFDAERRPIGQELLAKTDRTFTMLSLTNRLAVCLRNVLVPWVAPYITSPGALSHIYGFMSQFAINYRESAIVHTGTAFTGPVLAGDRAPDGDIYDDGVDGEGVAKRLYGILAPDSYYLVLFASSSSADSGSELEELERVAARFGDINTDKARVHIIVQERDGRHIYSEKLYDHYGFTSPGYAYIRPDYYVASIGNLEHVDEFLGWLK